MGKESASKYKGKTKTQLVEELEALNRRIADLERSKARQAGKGEEGHTGEYYKALIESSLDVIIVIDDRANIKYKSPSFEDIVVKGIKGQGQPFDFIYPEDMAQAMELWEQVLQKPDSVLRTEIRGMHKSGGTGYYAVAARNLLHNPAVGGIVVSFQDITERKQAEEELEKYRDKLEELVEERTEALKQEIAERRQAEQALRESEKFSSSLLEESPNPVLVMDLDTSIRYINPALEKLTGFSSSEVIGMKVPYPWWTEDTMKRIGESMDAKGQKGDTTLREFSVEELFQKKNGELFWIDLSFSVVEDEGEPKYYLTNWVDITERKQAEEELKKYHDQLEELVEERTSELKQEIAERKQAEEALEQGESYFQALIENAMDAIAIVGSDGAFAYESPSFKRLFGWTEEEHMGADPFKYIHGEDIQRTAEAFANLMISPGAVVKGEIRFWHKDGSLRTVEVVGQNLRDHPIVNGVVANLRDITERKKAEEELEKYRHHLEDLVEERTAELKKANEDLQEGIAERERMQGVIQQSEEKLRAIFESIGDALIVTDLTGTIIEANEAARRIGGYSSKDEIVGRNSMELIAAEDVDRAKEYMIEAFKKGQNVTIEHKMLTKDGREIDVEASGAMLRNISGKPVGVVSIAKDITERKRMQEDLLLKESALENSINAIAFSDMEGNITYVNRACLKMWGGGTKEDLIGKPYWELLEIQSEELLKEIAKSVFKDQVWEGEVSSKRKDGSEVILHVSTGIVNDSSGHPIQTVSAFIDITKYRKA